jgi:DNA-binding transcriptional LysR family regulator
MRYANQMISLDKETTEVMEELKRLNQAQVVIAVGPIVGDYLLPDVVAGFKRRFPDIDLRCHYVFRPDTGMIVPTISEKTLRFETDLALLNCDRSIPRVVVDRLWHAELVVCVGSEHPLARAWEVPAQELAGETFFWCNLAIKQQAEQAFKELGFVTRSKVFLQSPEAVKRLVMGGYGVTVLPRPVVADELRARRIMALNVRGFVAGYPVYCIRHEARRLTAAAESFLHFAKESAMKSPYSPPVTSPITI